MFKLPKTTKDGGFKGYKNAYNLQYLKICDD